jgi:hypothetical protein
MFMLRPPLNMGERDQRPPMNPGGRNPRGFDRERGRMYENTRRELRRKKQRTVGLIPQVHGPWQGSLY